MGERASDEVMCGREIRGIAQALPPSLDQRAVAARAGLPLPLIEIPLELCDEAAVLRLWRAILEESGDRTLPLRVGRDLPFGTYEVVDYLAASTATVGAAFQSLERYFGLITTWFHWSCDGQSEPPSVTLASSYQGPDENLVFVQFVLGVTFGRMNAAVERPLECLRVELALPDIGERPQHEAFFGCPVHYGVDRTRVELSRRSWDEPIVRRERGLESVLERHAAERLARVRAQDAEFYAVRMAIQEQLPKGPPSLAGIAKAMASSTRTLQRRLQAAGITFQALVEEERAAAARAYLRDRRLGNDEIAFLLGYSESSAFARAFRRWTGKTPREFRRTTA